jgi:hypothetical protein
VSFDEGLERAGEGSREFVGVLKVKESSKRFKKV